MDAHDVSPIVNSAKYDGPECIQPVSDDEMPSTGQLSLLRLLLVSPSPHAVIEDLLLDANVSKGGLTCALIQIAVIVALTLSAARSWGLLTGASRQKHRRNDQ
jgi:hypothetical protein